MKMRRRGDFLELAFKLELGECVNILAHVHMIGVGVIALVGNVCHAAEFQLVYSCKPIAQRLCRCAVKGKSNAGFFLPGICCLS